MDKLKIWIAHQDYETMVSDSGVTGKRKNSRLLIKDADNTTIHEPIIGYAQEPILPLVATCEPLINIIPSILVYATIALERTPDIPPDGLTRDESAAIRLYTMEWDNTYESLYSCLNRILRTADRKDLHLWFKYLKLFFTALVKLPCIPPQVVWRGIKKNTNIEFEKGATIIWWAFSSTTTSLTALENELYLGTNGERTLFSIEIINGRNISAHSYFPDEEEILLLPGTYMEVQSQLNPAPGLNIIHMKQMIPNRLLLEPPFEGASIYPKTQLNRRWYLRKRFIIPISVLLICFIIAIIISSILASKHNFKTSDDFIKWNENNWATACDFVNNDFSNVHISSKYCHVKCLLTSKCTHYTWSSWQGGTCWMKKNNVSRSDAIKANDSSLICGIIDSSLKATAMSTVWWDENDWALSCDFIGNDFAHDRMSPELCERKCIEIEACTHYTWSSYEGGTCWMKTNNISKSDAILTNSTDLICGVIDDHQLGEISWNGNDWAMSCDFIGNDLSNVHTSLDLCPEICAQTPKCTHYTWVQNNDGTCLMKQNNVTKDDAYLTNDPNMMCGVI